MTLIFTKKKFEEDFATWANEQDWAEYNEDINNPAYWVNICDGHYVGSDWKIGSYTIDRDWCEEREEY